MKFRKFLRAPFLKEHLRWLLLTVLWVTPRHVHKNFSKSPSAKELNWKNFSLEGYPDNCPWLGLGLELGLDGNFHRGQLP